MSEAGMNGSGNEARRILMVEDEALIRMLTTDMLEVLGFAVAEAGTAAEAMEIAAGDQPLAAALVDLGLPDRPGDELIRDLRQARPGLPIVVATGRDAEALSPQTRALDDLTFLEKPYDLPQLEQALEGVG